MTATAKSKEQMKSIRADGKTIPIDTIHAVRRITTVYADSDSGDDFEVITEDGHEGIGISQSQFIQLARLFTRTPARLWKLPYIR